MANDKGGRLARGGQAEPHAGGWGGGRTAGSHTAQSEASGGPGLHRWYSGDGQAL